MKHLGTKELESPRLLLRRFTTNDAEAIYRNWCSDEEVTKYLTWPTHKDMEVSRWVLTQWVESYLKPDYYQWAIVPKNLSEPIGCISVVSQDDRIAMAQIGYAIGKRWWHQGITSEALKRVTDFLFDEVGFNRIEARHDPRNTNSGAVMKKCGMRYEGTLRQADWNNTGVCDANYYALLASERML